ncbi:MAG: hypothetical protein JNK46_09270 [Methylobacteriaceae bacterium]|nr:hypothetical protein [Methylobacteriaceae bacterium]
MSRKLGLAVAFAAFACAAAPARAEIDNSILTPGSFREHKATYGLVYILPKEVNAIIDAKIDAPLKAKLATLGLKAEANAFNLPHVTVVHIHSADPTTPAKMLAALPKPPSPPQITLKTFYTTEAAKGAGHPWWFDLGIVKSGKGYDDLMAYNVVATAALTPLRDGPLPRVTGPVYNVMSDAAKELVRTVGVSGVNVVKDGKPTASHNPHNTLVYSMTPFIAPIQAEMDALAAEMNKVLPDGIDTTFRNVSIVEIGFMGNVLREFYRIDLATGAAIDVVSGRVVAQK